MTDRHISQNTKTLYIWPKTYDPISIVNYKTWDVHFGCSCIIITIYQKMATNDDICNGLWCTLAIAINLTKVI